VGLIHNFKYNGKIQLAKPLGAFLFAAFIHYWDICSIDLIIPVPLHIKRLRKRGFNQTFLLIRDWFRIAEDLNIKLSGIQIEKDLLVRNRWTKPQTGLNRKNRLTNIKNAFRIIDPEKVEKKRVLLVDDVYTTGATVNECAKVLLNAAALKVEVLTLARAGRKRSDLGEHVNENFKKK
jgi:ComF family protein